MRANLTNADSKGENRCACEDVLDEIGTACTDEGRGLGVVGLVIGGALEPIVLVCQLNYSRARGKTASGWDEWDGMAWEAGLEIARRWWRDELTGLVLILRNAFCMMWWGRG